MGALGLVEHWIDLWEGVSRTLLRFVFAYTVSMFDPNAHIPRINKGTIYLGTSLISGIRLARETHVNHRVIPTSNAINESVDLAHEIYNRVFRKVPERLEKI